MYTYFTLLSDYSSLVVVVYRRSTMLYDGRNNRGSIQLPVNETNRYEMRKRAMPRMFNLGLHVAKRKPTDGVDTIC